jgi:hypothetical protein
MMTSKSTDWPWFATGIEALLIALLPIRVTRPAKMRFGKASMRTATLSPIEMCGTSVSSTLTRASISARSATVSSSEPGLFIVPITAVSPAWMLSRVTRPLIGARIVVFASCSRASASAACACATPKRAGLVLRAGHGDLRPRLLQRLGRDQAVLARRELLGTAQRALRLQQVGARRGRLRLRLRDRGLGAPDGGLEARRVDAQQQVAALHPLPLLHRNFDDPAHDVGRDVDLALRLDHSARRDHGDEVAPLDDLRADERAALLARGDGQTRPFRARPRPALRRSRTCTF